MNALGTSALSLSFLVISLTSGSSDGIRCTGITHQPLHQAFLRDSAPYIWDLDPDGEITTLITWIKGLLIILNIHSFKYHHFSILPALPQTAPKLFVFLSNHVSYSKLYSWETAKQIFSHKHACCDYNRQEKHVVRSDIKR